VLITTYYQAWGESVDLSFGLNDRPPVWLQKQTEKMVALTSYETSLKITCSAGRLTWFM